MVNIPPPSNPPPPPPNNPPPSPPPAPSSSSSRCVPNQNVILHDTNQNSNLVVTHGGGIPQEQPPGYPTGGILNTIPNSIPRGQPPSGDLIPHGYPPGGVPQEQPPGSYPTGFPVGQGPAPDGQQLHRHPGQPIPHHGQPNPQHRMQHNGQPHQPMQVQQNGQPNGQPNMHPNFNMLQQNPNMPQQNPDMQQNFNLQQNAGMQQNFNTQQNLNMSEMHPGMMPPEQQQHFMPSMLSSSQGSPGMQGKQMQMPCNRMPADQMVPRNQMVPCNQLVPRHQMPITIMHGYMPAMNSSPQPAQHPNVWMSGPNEQPSCQPPSQPQHLGMLPATTTSEEQFMEQHFNCQPNAQQVHEHQCRERQGPRQRQDGGNSDERILQANCDAATASVWASLKEGRCSGTSYRDAASGQQRQDNIVVQHRQDDSVGNMSQQAQQRQNTSQQGMQQCKAQQGNTQGMQQQSVKNLVVTNHGNMSGNSSYLQQQNNNSNNNAKNSNSGKNGVPPAMPSTHKSFYETSSSSSSRHNPPIHPSTHPNSHPNSGQANFQPSGNPGSHPKGHLNSHTNTNNHPNDHPNGQQNPQNSHASGTQSPQNLDPQNPCPRQLTERSARQDQDARNQCHPRHDQCPPQMMSQCPPQMLNQCPPQMMSQCPPQMMHQCHPQQNQYSSQMMAHQMENGQDFNMDPRGSHSSGMDPRRAQSLLRADPIHPSHFTNEPRSDLLPPYIDDPRSTSQIMAHGGQLIMQHGGQMMQHGGQVMPMHSGTQHVIPQQVQNNHMMAHNDLQNQSWGSENSEQQHQIHQQSYDVMQGNQILHGNGIDDHEAMSSQNAMNTTKNNQSGISNPQLSAPSGNSSYAMMKNSLPLKTNVSAILANPNPGMNSTNPTNLTSGTPSVNTTNGVPLVNPTNETSNMESTNETSNMESTNETSNIEPANETSNIEPANGSPNVEPTNANLAPSNTTPNRTNPTNMTPNPKGKFDYTLSTTGETTADGSSDDTNETKKSEILGKFFPGMSNNTVNSDGNMNSLDDASNAGCGGGSSINVIIYNTNNANGNGMYVNVDPNSATSQGGQYLTVEPPNYDNITSPNLIVNNDMNSNMNSNGNMNKGGSNMSRGSSMNNINNQGMDQVHNNSAVQVQNQPEGQNPMGISAQNNQEGQIDRGCDAQEGQVHIIPQENPTMPQRNHENQFGDTATFQMSFGNMGRSNTHVGLVDIPQGNIPHGDIPQGSVTSSGGMSIHHGLELRPMVPSKMATLPTNMPRNMPSDMSNNMPRNMPSYMSSNMPRNMPSDMSSNMPRNMPSNMSSNMPRNMPSNMSSNMPSNMSSNMPRNMPSNMSSNVPRNMPSNMSSNMPSSMSSNVGSNVPRNMPSNMSSNVGSNVVPPSMSVYSRSVSSTLGTTSSSVVLNTIGNRNCNLQKIPSYGPIGRNGANIGIGRNGANAGIGRHGTSDGLKNQPQNMSIDDGTNRDFGFHGWLGYHALLCDDSEYLEDMLESQRREWDIEKDKTMMDLIECSHQKMIRPCDIPYLDEWLEKDAMMEAAKQKKWKEPDEPMSEKSLFYLFYYDLRRRYYARQELYKLKWRYHRGYNLWFQRKGKPFVVNDRFEMGDVYWFDIYFGFEKKVKYGFKFEYKHLELMKIKDIKK